MSFSYGSESDPGPKGIQGPDHGDFVLGIANQYAEIFPLLSSIDPYEDRIIQGKELLVLLKELRRLGSYLKSEDKTPLLPHQPEREEIAAYLKRFILKVKRATLFPTQKSILKATKIPFGHLSRKPARYRRRSARQKPLGLAVDVGQGVVAHC